MWNDVQNVKQINKANILQNPELVKKAKSGQDPDVSIFSALNIAPQPQGDITQIKKTQNTTHGAGSKDVTASEDSVSEGISETSEATELETNIFQSDEALNDGDTSEPAAAGNNNTKANGQDPIVIHENAHHTAAGPQADGAPVIKFGANGKATSGYQMIKVPAMPKGNINDAEANRVATAADYVVKGANAPVVYPVPSPQNRLSDADKSLKAKGENILKVAQAAGGQSTAKKDDDKDAKGTEGGDQLNVASILEIVKEIFQVIRNENSGQGIDTTA